MGNSHLIFVISTLKLIYPKWDRTCSWKGPLKIIQSDCPSTSGLSKSESTSLIVLSKCLLSIYRPGASTHLARKPVPVSDHPPSDDIFLNVHSETCLVLLCAAQYPGSRGQHLPPCFPAPGGCREQQGDLSATSFPDWTNQVSSTSRHRTCLPALITTLLCSSGCFLRYFNILFMLWRPELYAVFMVRPRQH